MKICEKCGKPLSDFEAKFHAEAGSPPAVSEKCWFCSRAEEAFEGADVEHGGHKKQIALCIAGLVAIFLLYLPLLPYGNSHDLPLLLELYVRVFVALYIAIGAFVGYFILKRVFSRRKESSLRIDPPEQRYGTCYTPVTTSYEVKERYSGVFDVNKIVRGGKETVDRWEWNGTNNEKINGLSGAYFKLIEKIIYLLIYVFVGASFMFWGIPYVLYAIVKDRFTAAKRAKIPADLQRAYQKSLAAIEPMPLTYHDKVGFLVSRENCAKAPAPAATNSFLANFKPQEEKKEARLPFFFKRYGSTAYMIVGYKEGSISGRTFVLVKKENAPIEKRIVVGKEFADADPAAWQADWAALGAPAKATGNIAWYEEKMTALLKSTKKEILG